MCNSVCVIYHMYYYMHIHVHTNKLVWTLSKHSSLEKLLSNAFMTFCFNWQLIRMEVEDDKCQWVLYNPRLISLVSVDYKDDKLNAIK